MPTPDYTRRVLSRQLADYEGLLATIVGVEHLESGPGRRRRVGVATDRRVLVASVRDPAKPLEILYGDLDSVELIEGSDGVHVAMYPRGKPPVRVDALHDPAAGEIFVALVETRCGRNMGPTTGETRRVRLVSGPQ